MHYAYLETTKGEHCLKPIHITARIIYSPCRECVLETPVINREGLSIYIGGIPYLKHIIVVGAITGRLMAGLYYFFMMAFVIKRIY